MVDTCNIVCIGSSEDIDIELANEDITESLFELTSRAKFNIFKYLCFDETKDIKVFSLKLPENKQEIFIPFKPQQKDIIVFIVENTPSTSARKNIITGILKQLSTNQKTSLFLLVKVGKTNVYSELMDLDTISKSNLLVNLFDDNVSSDQTDLASALQHVKNTLSPMIINKFTFKECTFIASSFSFVCIGSGSAVDTEDSKDTIASCIKAFTKWHKTRNLKYLCVHDYETIKAAALGFPDIKHIVSNFYD